MKILNFKDDNDREIIVNMENFTYSQQSRDRDSSDYFLYFRNNGPMRLTWREFDRFEKALQSLIEND